MMTSTDSRTRDELIDQATDLADGHMKMMYDLIAIRRNKGLTQQDVARLLGVQVRTIKNFEHYDSDPSLSMIRRYALAVGARIDQSVQTVS